MQKQAMLDKPVQPHQRNLFLDTLRGLSLFGVLMSNISWMSGWIYNDFAGVSYAKGWGADILLTLCGFFITARGLGLFSILFAIGLCIQIEQSRRKGRPMIPHTLRRLGILSLFGIFHVLFFWPGDILLIYAVVGLLILPLILLKSRKLWLLATGMYAIFLSAPFWSASLLPGLWTKNFILIHGKWLLQKTSQVYGQGSWLEAMSCRLWEWSHFFSRIHWGNLFLYLTFFILGLALYQKGFIRLDNTNRTSVRRLFHFTFWPGISLQLLSLLSSKFFPLQIPGWGTLANGLARISWPLICLGYFAGLLILLSLKRWQRKLQFMAPLGRMTLTNYLLQSAVAIWVFNGHGLGLWGKINISILLTGGFLFFIFQIGFSYWWLKRFYYGPLEWIWRWLYYKSAPPFLIKNKNIR